MNSLDRTEVKMLYSNHEEEINEASLQTKKVVVSQKIKEFRRKNHLSQTQFAERFGITKQSVSKWEREECYPSITFLPVLAEAMGCEIDEFFT